MAIRTRDGALDVATDIYVKDDKAIAVMGVCHIADAAFWNGVNRRLSEYENMGYSVQYEMVRNDLTEEQKLKIKGNEGTSKLYEKLAEVTGMVAQSKAISYKPHWKNTDITMSQWLKMEKSAHKVMAMISEAAAGFEKIVELGGQERVGRDLRTGLRWMPVVQRIVPRAKQMESALLDKRNEIAANAMLTAEGNVVSVWGAGHLEGIGKILRASGYQRESRVWTTAINR